MLLWLLHVSPSYLTPATLTSSLFLEHIRIERPWWIMPLPWLFFLAWIFSPHLSIRLASSSSLSHLLRETCPGLAPLCIIIMYLPQQPGLPTLLIMIAFFPHSTILPSTIRDHLLIFFVCSPLLEYTSSTRAKVFV